MALTVEDGTAKTDADAYIDTADADTYHAARGNAAWADADAGDRETAIRRATQFLDLRYQFRFPGYRRTVTQALAWPRNGAAYRDGIEISNAAVPAEIVNATAELALRALAASLAPDQDRGGMVESQQLDVLAIKYFPGAPAGTTMPFIDDVLSRVLTSGRGFISVERGS